MALCLRGLVVLACAAALHGQSGASQPEQRTANLEPDWDIGVVLGEMGAHAGRMLATLDKMNPNAWVEKGASETYAEQLDSCKAQTKAFHDEAIALASNPQNLPAALQLLYRIEGADTMLLSLEDGIRKYQSPRTPRPWPRRRPKTESTSAAFANIWWIWPPSANSDIR